MYFFSVLVSFLLATSVAAKGNKTNSSMDTSEAGQCKEMVQLNALVELASNTTKLDKVTNNNATKIAEIQAMASSASTTLKTLESNNTLMAACAVIDAQQTENNECTQTFALQRFVKFAANSTAVTRVTNNNTTKIAKIQAEASKASVKLEKLTSNSTLQAACPAVMQKDECEFMKTLTRFVDVANNQTKLDKVAKNNATKEAEIKTLAAKAQTKLTAMQSNSTFMAACNALNAQEKGTSSSKGISSTNTKSTANTLKNAGGSTASLSAMLVVAFGMFAL